MQCTRCRSEIPAHSRFCLSCGQPVPVAPPPRTVMPPPPAAAPAGYAAAPPVTPTRRPIGPLILCIALLLVAVATAGTFLTMHSLAAAGRAGKHPNASMVAAAPKPAHGGEFVAAPPPNLGVKPITPAPMPVPSAPSPVVVNTPKPEEMPPDVYAYLSWLAQQNEDRKTAEREGQNALTGLLDKLLTGGMGSDFTDREDSPAPENARLFDEWNDRLIALHRNARGLVGLDYFWRTLKAPGSPHVPSQCVLLHGMYVNAIGLQEETARQVKVFMARQDMADVQNQLKVGKRAEEMLRRSNDELGRVCAIYRVTPWFGLSPTAGDLPPMPFLPR